MKPTDTSEKGLESIIVASLVADAGCSLCSPDMQKPSKTTASPLRKRWRNYPTGFTSRCESRSSWML